MNDTTIIRPAYYRVVIREGRYWKFRQGTPFFNPLGVTPPYKQEDIFAAYNTTMTKVALELFRINGGKTGYYLANLQDKQYHYCGTSFDDVKTTLIALGIGKADPLDP